MLKAGNLARLEDHRVRGSKAGEPEQIGGYPIYAEIISHVWISQMLCPQVL